MKIKFIFLFLLCINLGLKPQPEKVEKIWVFFTDKSLDGFEPSTFFDQKALERRQLMGIEVSHTDAPVNLDYISDIEQITQNNRAVSRWFNAMCCLASVDQIEKLRKMSFVKSVRIVNQPISHNTTALYATDPEKFIPNADDLNFIRAQVRRMQIDEFRKYKIDGTGTRVAIFDVGFKSYRTNPAFEHIRKANRIIKTYDFTRNKENVEVGGTHGTVVMSCIGGRINGTDMGLATGAEFLLARTETRTEFFAEEENWLAAAEWADKNGADIINSSLGYTYHRYFREEMDGEHSLVARAANMAASKGILVINSAGNDGNGSWKIIGTPADADSVLAVGGIKPKSGVHTSFSSFGPTRDKRPKPNVTAYGHVMATSPKGIAATQGTSFSCPLVAGFAACARQSRPTYFNMQLFEEIEKSGDLYPYFDYAHGYGVPQASYFFKMPNTAKPTFTFEYKGDRIYIRPESVEKSLKNQLDSSKMIFHKRYVALPDYVFYHIRNKNGYLDKYFVVDGYGSLADKILQLSGQEPDSPLAGEGPLVIKKSDYAKPFTLRAFYKGYVEETYVK